MQLKLGGVLTCLAVRPGKPQRQRLVDRFTGQRIAHARQPRLAWRGQPAHQRLQRIAGARTRNPDHADRRRHTAGRQRKDGIAGAHDGAFNRIPPGA